MNVVLYEGRVRVECPECGHWQRIDQRIGEVHCVRCKHLIQYDLNMTAGRFAALKHEARTTLEFRRVS